MAKRITKKILKTFAFIGGGILILLLAFHLWFVNHAEELIENLVEAQSNGKLKLKVRKFKFNWFSHKMELQNAVFYSTDTVTSPIAYRFKVDRIKIQVNALLPVIFEKKIYIDSLHLINPDISVTKLRSVRDTSDRSDPGLSLPQEMGRIYNSIQDALQVLRVDRFQIDNGKFSLINKAEPEEKPVTITRLFFHLDNLRVDSAKTDAQQKILFSDNVSLQTTQQDIVFPDGRHRLSFGNFRINILKRLVEFDSCTIVATKGDSSKTSFRIFFDKLRMTNINFDTLYHRQVIKADSVYCINPEFRLDVSLGKRTALAKPPPLNDLIQQLTGDMQLAFVVVENGSFDINTVREGRPSYFRSDHNNFELQGLRIQKNAPKPLVVERFAMAIRNYENFLRDSAYAIQFDSVLINNNRISLSNFSYKELRGDKVINHFMMPQFELYGLSWDNLVFEQQLKAERVTLYKPVINYNLTQSRNRQTQDIFETLAGLGTFMQLNNLNIVDGKINLFFKNNAQLQLENATIFVKGQQLVASRRLARLRQSFDLLNFRKGIFKMNGLEIGLGDVQFNGSTNQLRAGIMHIKDHDKLSLDATHVSVNAMTIDEKLQHMAIDGIHWEQANVVISSLPGAPLQSKGGLVLKNIGGRNTSITVNNGMKKVSLVLPTLSADEFAAGAGNKVILLGFAAKGNGLEIINNNLRATIQTLDIADHRVTELKNILYTNYAGPDSVHIAIPSVTLIPDINAIINGRITAGEVMIFQPDIQLHLSKSADLPDETKKKLPELSLGKVVIRQPHLDFLHKTAKGISSIEWQGEGEKTLFELDSINVSNRTGAGVSVGSLRFFLDRFRHSDPNGKSFDAGKGELSGQIKRFSFAQDDAGNWEWQGNISELVAREFTIDSLGKKGGRLTIHSGKLNDLSIGSSTLLNLRELISHNRQFRLHEISGSFENSEDQYKWDNISYDKGSRQFSMDSFSYHPALQQEAFVKAQPWQSDYMTMRSGAVHIGPFDIERYIRDTILDLGVVSIDKFHLTDFRDKRVPREPGAITLLPVPMLKKIPVRLLVDSVKVNDALVEYEEVNEKNSQAGKITVNRLNGRIATVRNFNLRASDSLQVRASGYLENKIYTRLNVKVSYTDTLGGFLMTGQMGPADITVLNPVLRPLASIELRSGLLDSMNMRVSGTEYMAFGEMKMLYHDLKVRVVKPGEKKKSMMSGVFTFLANTLIKNKNTEKTGVVFFKRLRDRSAINYLVKIALSGFASNIGIKNNKKQVRRNHIETGKHPLPPPDTD